MPLSPSESISPRTSLLFMVWMDKALEARGYLLGWKAYFGLAIWRGLEEWLRHRLRAIQLRHWKRPKTIYRELKALGASEDVAKQVAGNCHRWWRNSAMLLNKVLTIAYFDRLGGQTVLTSNSRTARCGPACRVVWQGRSR